MGALFRRPVEVCAGAGKGAALRRRYPVVGCCAALRYGGCPAGGLPRAAVAIGSEGRGLSEEVLALCDQTIRLPMSERCESLNAAVAAAVLLLGNVSLRRDEMAGIKYWLWLRTRHKFEQPNLHQAAGAVW